MRQYLVVKADEKIIPPDASLATISATVREILKKAIGAEVIDSLGIEIVAAPSLRLRWMIENEAPRNVVAEDGLPEYVVSFTVPDTVPDREIVKALNALYPQLGDLQEPGSRIFVPDGAAFLRNIGADPVAHLCGFRPCAPARVFGDRSRVRDMMGIGALRESGLRGKNVNVMIVDQGLNRDGIKEENWGGGLAHNRLDPDAGRGASSPFVEPGSAPLTSHGMMIARNILDIAPEAKIYDVSLIPPHIGRANVFASTAHAVFKAAVEKIARLKASSPEPNSAWILVNAWAIFDRSGEYPPGDYTLNKRQEILKVAAGKFSWELGHPLNRIIQLAVQNDIDVVFGAGNCGQFTASTRCGKFDRGEGRSIWGANAHPSVLTVGAVSADDQWLGYSSQGPAPWSERDDDPPEKRQKPDVCAPSNFCEDHDAAKINSGTSASTGLAAGVIAAIRQDHKPDQLKPLQLKAAINASARAANGEWNARTGNGLLNAAALLKQLGTA
jgi:subtilisin family serine protease